MKPSSLNRLAKSQNQSNRPFLEPSIPTAFALKIRYVRRSVDESNSYNKLAKPREISAYRRIGWPADEIKKVFEKIPSVAPVGNVVQ